MLALLTQGCVSGGESSLPSETVGTEPNETGSSMVETYESTAPESTFPDPEGILGGAEDLDTDSEGYCVLDDSGNVFIGKDIFKTFAPASITKVLTALVAAESVSPDNEVTVTEEAVTDHLGILSSGVRPSFKPGEKMKVRDLLYALILPSTNAAGNILAFHIAGSVEGFVDMMNEKVRELKLTHSHFMNPHGMDEDGHYTCAYDMAVILKAATENEVVKKILGSYGYTIPETEYESARKVYASTGMQAVLSIPGVFAAKPGATAKAASTMVTAVSRNGRSFYICTLHADENPDQLDVKNIVDYVYARVEKKAFSPVPFAHELRMKSADDKSVTFTYNVANQAESVRIVFWNQHLGTGSAKFFDDCPNEKTNEFTISPDYMGVQLLQIFAAAKDGTEKAICLPFLFDGKVHDYGLAEWNGERYFVDGRGFLLTGIFETPDGCYGTRESGEIAYGFLGSGYYAGPDGKVVSGWMDISGYRYYFQGDGRMATGRMMIHGKLYTFAANGVLIH